MKTLQTDYLIIGSGIAGLTVAIKLAEKFPERRIVIATKSNEEESNTKYAQGGIAVVTDFNVDDFEKHIQDTMACGDGLCNREIVEMVIKEGPERLSELIEWGTNFDLSPDGNLNLAKEGGHSNSRVVHYKDQTGREIERAILEKAHQKENIDLLDFHFASDLIIESGRCIGAFLLDEKNETILAAYSSFTILATGGIGAVYTQTTNPAIATGDGIAMAIRAKATIKDMEFIQFHPTALYAPKLSSTFLISEAVRGFGAFLKTRNGRRFMIDYDIREELASRDIVSRAIETELKMPGATCVYLDCTHLDIIAFKKHFPTIHQNCILSGINIQKDWIPVIPVQHYVCGGISVNRFGQSSVKNLFACGECAHTGLHGANRLASNSLLEALVFANQIFIFLSDKALLNSVPKEATEIVNHINSKHPFESIKQTKNQLQDLMQRNAGIVRNNDDLQKALKQLRQWKYKYENPGLYHLSKDSLELINSIEVSIAVVESSLNRSGNSGCFFKEQQIISHQF